MVDGPATARSGRRRVLLDEAAGKRVERMDEICLPIVRSLGAAIVSLWTLSC